MTNIARYKKMIADLHLDIESGEVDWGQFSEEERGLLATLGRKADAFIDFEQEMPFHEPKQIDYSMFEQEP